MIEETEFISDFTQETDSIVVREDERKPRGFQNPEIQKIAMQRSQAVRSKDHLELKQVDTNELIPRPDERFVPTRNMRAILKIALSLESGDSIRAWFSSAGLNRNAWYEWKRDPRFLEWWKQAFLDGIKQYETQWILIGLKKMSKDYRYWAEVGKKLYGFIDKISIKDEKSPEELELYTHLLELFKSTKTFGVAVQMLPTPEEALAENAIDVDYLEQEVNQELKKEGS